MTPTNEICVRFIPSSVEGMADVSEVTVFADRLEIRTGSGSAIYLFTDFARRQQSWAMSVISHLFKRASYLPTVGERNWFAEHSKDRYFRFYTQPELKICMPEDEQEGYGESLFPRIHAVLCAGGYSTHDLG